MRLDKRLAIAEEEAGKLVERTILDEEVDKRWQFILERFSRLVSAASDLMGPEEQERLDAALNALADRVGPLDKWIWKLGIGRCRLPEMHAEAMRDLLRARLSGECDSADWVCDGCGLARPTRKTPPLSARQPLPGAEPNERPLKYELPPDFFDGCPACSCAEWTWITRVDEQHHGWLELDGCMRPWRTLLA